MNVGYRYPHLPAKHYLTGFAATAALTGPGTAALELCVTNDSLLPPELAPYNCAVGGGLSFEEGMGYPLSVGTKTVVGANYAEGLVNPGGFSGTADQSFHFVSTTALSHLLIVDWAIPLPF